ncbi:MAG: flagellar brake protein [Betaproteobacteria bacterium]|nr:flagellar brake protein [Betaproteobacteria bacterium]
MRAPTDTPVKFELASADESRYQIDAPLEIASILEPMQRKGTIVTVFFDQGSDFVLTSVLEVAPRRGELILELGADADANRRALASREIVFVAMLDRVKVQFVAHGLRRAAHAGRDAFALDFPETLLRLQRREYYRLVMPVTRPVKCAIASPAPTGTEAVELTILDMSCGGIAVIDHREGPGFEPGTLLHGCRIALPEIGTVAADLRVRSTFEVTLKNGQKRRRSGCEFVGLREAERALIQRYIHKIEREVNVRLKGLR